MLQVQHVEDVIEMTGYVVDEDSPYTLKHSQLLEVPPERERERERERGGERERVFVLLVCVLTCARVPMCTCV